MRWGKPIIKERVRDPRYFLNEDFCDEHGVCEKEFQEAENSNKDIKAKLNKAFIMAKRMGNNELAEKYLTMYKTMLAKELKEQSIE